MRIGKYGETYSSILSSCDSSDKDDKQNNASSRKITIDEALEFIESDHIVTKRETHPFYAYKNVTEAPEVIKEAARAVVKVSMLGSLGTGVFVSERGLLMTNDHVLGTSNCPQEGCYFQIYDLYQSDKKYKKYDVLGKPILINVEQDVAIFQISKADGGDFEPVHWLEPKFINYDDLLEQELHMIGHPAGWFKKWSIGRLLRRHGKNIFLDMFVIGGSSGSPILTSSGEFVAIKSMAFFLGSILTESGANFIGIAKLFYNVFSNNDSWSSVLREASINDLIPLKIIDSKELVLEYRQLFLANHKNKVVIDGTEQHIADVLLKNCSIENPLACAKLLAWVECREESAVEYQKCFDDEITQKLSETVLKIFDNLVEVNGFVASINWISLFFNKLSGKDEEKSHYIMLEKLEEALARYKLGLDIDFASSLIEIGYFNTNLNPEYQSVNLFEYVWHYEQLPNYQFFLKNICSAITNIYSREWVSMDVFREKINVILDDKLISISDKLQCEELLYINVI